MSKWANATDKEREDAPADIFAGPGRSYPIADEEDLRKAIQSFGRSSDPVVTKRGIIRRAKALDKVDVLPEEWNVPDGDGDTDDKGKGMSEPHPMVSKDAMKRTQQIHDHAVAMGATCTAPTVSNQPYYVMPGAMMGERIAVDGAQYRAMVMPLPSWFTEADAPPEWIPYLPTPTTFKHPQYGDVALTPERIANFVQNFNAGVYQPEVTLDGEHQTKLSGAMAWITRLRQNEDGSADAQVRWTPRGKKLYADGAYKYVSPEWYDEWTDPATGETHRDVAIGGALTTRPFFKPPHLRPLAASEDSSDQPNAGERSQSMTATTDTVSPAQFSELQQQFAELQGTVQTLTTERDEAKQAAEKAAAENTALSERVAAMEKDARDKRFAEEVRHWTGDPKANIARLEKVAARYGEDSDDFREECRDRRAFAEQQRQNRAVGGTLFGTVGSDQRQDGSGADAQARLNAMAEARAKEKGITPAKAMTELLQDPANADLYEEATAPA